MPIKYQSVVPWGRSYQEYLDMFQLSPADLDKSILGCGDGPASFNAAMTRNGRQVVSADPLYHFTASEIEQRIRETIDIVIEQTRMNQDKFIWTKLQNIEEMGRIRMAAMRDFLADYEKGKRENRYVAAELPGLPFADDQFDLALSSHFLFLYSDNLSLDFHLKAIAEMLRLAREVRIFPILDVNGGISPYVSPVRERYAPAGYITAEVKVDYEFQKGGHTMLRLLKPPR